MSTLPQKPMTKAQMRRVFLRYWGSQRKLASEMGVGPSTLTAWLTDRNKRTNTIDRKAVERRALELLEKEKQDQTPAVA